MLIIQYQNGESYQVKLLIKSILEHFIKNLPDIHLILEHNKININKWKCIVIMNLLILILPNKQIRNNQYS